jgi:predicted short-subunit dehydrogenase-like oxidoreductase (DUF2520 family)
MDTRGSDLVLLKTLATIGIPRYRSGQKTKGRFLLSSRAVLALNNSDAKTVSLIGAGNLAAVLGPALRSAGYRIESVAFRNAASSQQRAMALAKRLVSRAVRLKQAEPAADIIWVCHTDDALAETARQLARKPGWRGKIVFHSSGALTSDVLAPLKRAGAHTASLHPMMTFVPGTSPRLKGVPFAVEGDRQAVAAAREITRAVGAEIFSIGKDSKVLYHALGSFSSPLLVATLVTAERVGRAAGLSRAQTRRVITPILHQTLRNYLERGAAAAFSGPIKRGDLETIRQHLRALKNVPAVQDVYRALVKSALRDLPAARKNELLRLLHDR